MNPPREKQWAAAPKNPGLPDAKRKRRSKTEMQEARERAAIAKAAEEQRAEESLLRIACLEEAMEVGDLNAESAHPRTINDITKAVKMPPAHVRVMQNRKEQTNSTALVDSDDTDMQPSMVMQPRVTRNRKEQTNSMAVVDGDDIDMQSSMVMQPRVMRNRKEQTNSMAVVDGDDTDMQPSMVMRPRPRPIQPGGRVLLAYRQILESNDLENNGEIVPKDHLASTTAVHQQIYEEPDTTRQSDQRPHVTRRLERTYAIADISSHEKEVYSNDEAPTDHDNDFEYIEESHEYTDDHEYVDDDPTPRKKRRSDVGQQVQVDVSVADPVLPKNKGKEPLKGNTKKLGMREQVDARRGKPEGNMVYEDRDDIDTNEPEVIAISTKTKKPTWGLTANWPPQVAKKASTSQKPISVCTAPQVIASGASHARSTRTSNVIIESAKGRELKTEDNAVVSFFEESEEPERQAALNSPVKGKVRLTSASTTAMYQSMIKTEPGIPAPKPLSKKEKFTNNDLPAGCQDNHVWRRNFITTYISIIGSRLVSEAWTLEDHQALAILKKVWDYIYGVRITTVQPDGRLIPYSIEHNGPVFSVAEQCLMEWRGGFGFTALTVVQAFFDDQEMDTKARQEFATTALDQHHFIYLNVEESKHTQKLKRTGIFRGPFIVQTLSSHINSICGASDVPSLWVATSGNSTFCLGTVERLTIALALSSVAVERVLTLWRDGFITCDSVVKSMAMKQRTPIIKPTNKASGKESKETDFNSATWGRAATGYLHSIKGNLTGDQKNDKKFEAVMNDVNDFLKSTRSTGNLNDPSAVLIEDDDTADGRALLCEDSDSDY